jgi:hypothetical protein
MSTCVLISFMKTHSISHIILVKAYILKKVITGLYMPLYRNHPFLLLSTLMLKAIV